MSTIAEKLFQEIAEDKRVEKATESFSLLRERSDRVASKVLTALLEENESNDEFTLDELTLGLAQSMMYLTHLFFEEKSQHQDVEQFVRGQLAERVLDTVLSPQPCLACENCDNGEECQNPNFPSIPFVSFPILSSVLIEEAYWKAYLSDSND